MLKALSVKHTRDEISHHFKELGYSQTTRLIGRGVSLVMYSVDRCFPPIFFGSFLRFHPLPYKSVRHRSESKEIYPKPTGGNIDRGENC